MMKVLRASMYTHIRHGCTLAAYGLSVAVQFVMKVMEKFVKFLNGLQGLRIVEPKDHNRQTAASLLLNAV